MRRLVLACLVLGALIVCWSGLSQAGPMAVGFRLGMNVARFYGEDTGEAEGRVGLCLGGFSSYDFSKNFALQGEVLYTQKGDYDEEESNGVISSARVNLHYLEIPMLAKFILPRGSFTPSLYLGPAVAFEIGSSFEFKIGGLTVEGDLTDVKDVDVGLALGTGLGFGSGPTKFIVDLRYTAGLASIDDSGGLNQLDWKNSVATLSLGMSFQP